MNLRPYQIQLSDKATAMVNARGIVYCAMEMRVGKTLIALQTAANVGAKRVLFATKKKAIASVRGDYDNGGYGFDLTVTNYEQLHNLTGGYDCIIADEAHSFGAFPKPSLRAKELRRLTGNAPLILLSGTPSPESYSQLYHQFWLSGNSPFKHKNFYRWADEFVTVRDKHLAGRVLKDYSNADHRGIMAVIGDYFVRFTQADAGFNQAEVREMVQYVDTDTRIGRLVAALLKDRYYRMKDGAEIVCDTPVKLQSKIHQIYSGTVITESGDARNLVASKIEYIKQNYAGRKIAIFHKFTAEGNALRAAFPTATDSPEVFARCAEAVFVCQIAAGAMGINLSSADVLIFYNIDFSSQLYWQARARLSDKNRTTPPLVHWLFSRGGIEEKIYKAVIQKKDYTNYYFQRDYLK